MQGPTMNDDDLIDTKGIAAELGLTSVEYVRQRIVTRSDFPPPVINFSARSRKWRRDDVRALRAERVTQAA